MWSDDEVAPSGYGLIWQGRARQAYRHCVGHLLFFVWSYDERDVYSEGGWLRQPSLLSCKQASKQQQGCGGRNGKCKLGWAG